MKRETLLRMIESVPYGTDIDFIVSDKYDNYIIEPEIEEYNNNYEIVFTLDKKFIIIVDKNE